MAVLILCEDSHCFWYEVHCHFSSHHGQIQLANAIECFISSNKASTSASVIPVARMYSLTMREKEPS